MLYFLSPLKEHHRVELVCSFTSRKFSEKLNVRVLPSQPVSQGKGSTPSRGFEAGKVHMGHNGHRRKVAVELVTVSMK